MNRDFVGMNERNGACLRLPASCSLSSYIVLLFQDCRRKRKRGKRSKLTAKWENEDGKERCRREKPARRGAARRSGFGPGCSGVALPCGDHKGSRRILILVSPNLLTYLTYPEELTEDSSGTLRQLNPKSSLFFQTQSQVLSSQLPILLFASLFSLSFLFSFSFSLHLSLCSLSLAASSRFQWCRVKITALYAFQALIPRLYRPI